MNKFVIAAAVAALSTPALAEISPNQDLTINLNATVANQCGVYNVSNIAGGNPITTINFNDLAGTPATSEVVAEFQAMYICNVASGFTRVISSANSGNLWRAGTMGGANNAIPYTLLHGGGSPVNFPATQLTAPITTSFAGSAVFLAGKQGSIVLRVKGVQVAATNPALNTTNVFAGNYRDVVTVDIVGN